MDTIEAIATLAVLVMVPVGIWAAWRLSSQLLKLLRSK